MSKERIAMRKIREVLRLKYGNKISMNQISAICKISRSTVQDYIRRFETSDLSWPLEESISDEILENKFFPSGKNSRPSYKSGLDYNYLLQELRKKNVTMEVLWSEYKQANPNGYQYSYFCELITAHKKKCQYSMRQIHKGGEKGFIDFGTGLNFIDPETGECRSTQLFVFCWGASNHLFARAVLSENLPAWIQVNVEALDYFGCSPKVLIPDNLKSAVTKACRYEPTVNAMYTDFAQHYGTTIMPARPRRPKDKAKAENGVKLGKRWILARLRNHIFTSLHQLNEAIAELLEQFNNRTMKKYGKSRKEMFIQLDRPNALELPEKRYVFAEWKWATVNINYHVRYDNHEYSVPYTTGFGQKVGIRATGSTIEIYKDIHKNSQRICSHLRSYQRHGYSTTAEHMPPSHRKYLEWTPERIMSWAGKYGSSVKQLVENIMSKRVFPEQAYKSCLGIIRLEKHYSAEKLDAACRRALDFKIDSYTGVKNILSKELESKKNQKSAPSYRRKHENIRGADYFSQSTNQDSGQKTIH
jgi:transposase